MAGATPKEPLQRAFMSENAKATPDQGTYGVGGGMSLGLPLGAAFGLAVGAALGNAGLGLMFGRALGIVFGAGLGFMVDQRSRPSHSEDTHG